MPYNLRSTRARERYLEREARTDDSDSDADYEIRSNSGSEQDASDFDEIDDQDNISADDLQDGVEQRRAKRTRRRGTPDEDTPLDRRLPGRPRTKLYGKNGFIWETQQGNRHSDRLSILSDEGYEGDLAGAAQELDEIEGFWDLLFNQDMIDIIVERTNARIEEESAEAVGENRNQTHHHRTDATEIRAFMGLLYHIGQWKSCHVDVHELWDSIEGLHLC